MSVDRIDLSMELLIVSPAASFFSRKSKARENLAVWGALRNVPSDFIFDRINRNILIHFLMAMDTELNEFI